MNYVAKGAIISNDGRYRYKLWREWRGDFDPTKWRHTNYGGRPWHEPLSCLFVMLNPSTADGEAGLIVCAWGAHGGHLRQDQTLRGWLPSSKVTYALGLTKVGYPKHPLYLPASAPLVVYK